MAEKSNRIYLLEEAGVASALLKLGIPTMVGMLISALYNAIDAYFVGGLGMSQMGAVSVVFPIVQIIIGLGMMFGAGASSYISRLLGKGDRHVCHVLYAGIVEDKPHLSAFRVKTRHLHVIVIADVSIA